MSEGQSLNQRTITEITRISRVVYKRYPRTYDELERVTTLARAEFQRDLERNVDDAEVAITKGGQAEVQTAFAQQRQSKNCVIEARHIHLGARVSEEHKWNIFGRTSFASLMEGMAEIGRITDLVAEGAVELLSRKTSSGGAAQPEPTANGLPPAPPVKVIFSRAVSRRLHNHVLISVGVTDNGTNYPEDIIDDLNYAWNKISPPDLALK